MPSRIVLLIAVVQREYFFKRLTFPPIDDPDMASIARSVPATIRRFPLSFAVALILPPMLLPSIERIRRSVPATIRRLALPFAVFFILNYQKSNLKNSQKLA